MDVVPTDPARWTQDPFGAEIADGKMWGRGTIDMKGIGTSYLYAFIMLHRQKVPLTRDVLLMFVPDEEVGGALGAEWMRKNHYDELDPGVRDRRGGLRQPRHVHAPASWSSASRSPRRRSCGSSCAPKGSRATDRSRTSKNPNDHLMRGARRACFAEPMPTAPFPRRRHDEAARRRTARRRTSSTTRSSSRRSR